MSTAARPTFNPAIGKSTLGGFNTRSISAKDQAAHTKLKFRKFGQASIEEMETKNLKINLQQKECLLLIEGDKSTSFISQSASESASSLKLLTNSVDLEAIKRKYNDEDADKNTPGDGFDSRY
jgi:hypothetical protein